MGNDPFRARPRAVEDVESTSKREPRSSEPDAGERDEKAGKPSVTERVTDSIAEKVAEKTADKVVDKLEERPEGQQSGTASQQGGQRRKKKG